MFRDQPNHQHMGAVKALKKKMRDNLNECTETEDVALLGAILNAYTKGFEHMPAEKERAE